jgi:hypothetical protein
LTFGLALRLLERVNCPLGLDLALVRLQCSHLVEVKERAEVVSRSMLWTQALLEAREGVVCRAMDILSSERGAKQVRARRDAPIE